ncbi:MAG: hypothetical protein CMI00_11110 [Oceanospirillaceae bacterium]|nr:hypothetical protein [Oceanospirillaceae bacterium]
MDRQFFIPPAAVIGSTVETKVLDLLNSFATTDDFDVIQDRAGLGYAIGDGGVAIGDTVAQRILDIRPAGGFTSLTELVDIGFTFVPKVPGFGPDKFSDLVMSAIALSGGDKWSLSGSFRSVDPAELEDFNANSEDMGRLERARAIRELMAGTLMTESIDVIVFGRFRGSSLDIVVPLLAIQTDGGGEYRFDNLTFDYEEFCLVAAKSDSEGFFHRSGAMTFSGDDMEYRPVLIQQAFTLENDEFRETIEEKAGSSVDGDKILEEITSSFKDGYIELRGTILAPNTLLWADSRITFTNELRFLPTHFTPGWVNDLEEVIGVSSVTTEQNHSNAGFIILAVLAFFLPGGLFWGSLLTILFILKDRQLDNSEDTKALIADALSEAFTDEFMNTLEETVDEQINGIGHQVDDFADEVLEELPDILPGSDDRQEDRAAEREQRRADLIDYMSGRVTVESVVTTPTELTMQLWVTTPIGDESFDWTPVPDEG